MSVLADFCHGGLFGLFATAWGGFLRAGFEALFLGTELLSFRLFKAGLVWVGGTLVIAFGYSLLAFQLGVWPDRIAVTIALLFGFACGSIPGAKISAAMYQGFKNLKPAGTPAARKP